MLKRAMIAAVVLGAASGALAAPTTHAGEWETRNGDGPAHRVCQANDHVLDEATMNKAMAMVGVQCGPATYSAVGDVVNYTVTCAVGGGHLTTHSTTTTTGPDAYISHLHSHFEGGSMKAPDMDDTQVARRLGPCQPGEPRSPF